MEKQIYYAVTPKEFKEMLEEAVHNQLQKAENAKPMSFQETCEYLKCSASGLSKWMRENRVPYKRIGKRVYFFKEELNAAFKNSQYDKLRKLDKLS